MSSWYTDDMSALHIKMPTNVDNLLDSYYDFIKRVGKNKDIAFLMSKETFMRVRSFKTWDGEYLWNVSYEQPCLVGEPIYFDNLMDDIILTTANMVRIPQIDKKGLTPLTCHVCSAPLPETLKCDYCSTIHYLRE